MITIHLALYGNLIRYKENPHDKYTSLEILPGTKLSRIMEEMGMGPKEAGIILCGGEKVTPDYIPRNNEKISFYSLMSAG